VSTASDVSARDPTEATERAWVRWIRGVDADDADFDFDADERRARWFVTVMSPVGVVLGAVWTAFYALQGYPWPVWASMAALPVLAPFGPPLLRRGVSARLVALGDAIIVQVSLFVAAWYAGGIASYPMFCALVMPFFPTIAGFRAGGFVLFVGTGAGALLLILGEAVGGLPPAIVPHPLLQASSSWGSAFLVLSVAIYGYRMLTERALAEARSLNDSLRWEIIEHCRTRDDLVATQARLLEAAHVAGMAEVATGVLHNVGNGLNAVHVSAAMLAEGDHAQLDRRLTRLAELLDESARAEFDVERVDRAARYAERLARAAEQDRVARAREVDRLRSGIEHVTHIVQAQQSYARSVGVQEATTVRAVLDQVTMLVDASYRAADVALEVEVDELPPILVERHKVVQILANLLTNARDASVDGPPERVVRVLARRVDHAVQIEVRDQGVGIDAVVLPRIFQHGFTTKPTGHGFGLHASAVAAAEIGGSLRAESPGPQRGATFTLTLPLTPPSNATVVPVAGTARTFSGGRAVGARPGPVDPERG
jgi:signal transduction histidine kinase